jgi:hypothetical protein
MAATIQPNAVLTARWRRRHSITAPLLLMERPMSDQFSKILLSHPAYLSGRVMRPESEFAAYERLERKPYRRSQPAPEIKDRLSLADGVTTLVGLLVLLAAVLAS